MLHLPLKLCHSAVLAKESSADKYEKPNMREILVRVVQEVNYETGGAQLRNWWCPSSSCSAATDACMEGPFFENLSFIPGRFLILLWLWVAGHIEGSGSPRSKIILF